MWTLQQIELLAPDAASLKAGRQLAEPDKWSGLGQSPESLWGLCQGSGKNPYQAQVELSGPAFRCTCPSRKFPCKHTLGLLMLWNHRPSALPAQQPPAWVSDWLAGRQQRAQKKVELGPEGNGPRGDAESQARRAALRESRVGEGVAFLATWMKDLARTGLSGLPTLPENHWNVAAARLVDAQAPGLARLVRRIPEILALSHWPTLLSEHLGRMHLLVEGYQRLPQLEAPLAAEIRSRIGWTQSQEQLLAQEGVSDEWWVVGQRSYEEEQLKVARTWLWGRERGRMALLLEFAVGGAAFATSSLFVVGSVFQGELVYFGGAYPLRALVKSRVSLPSAGEASTVPGGFCDFAALLQGYADALAHNPWLEEVPALLTQVTPGSSMDSLVDAQGTRLPLTAGAAGRLGAWRLAAVSGGHPVTVFGEWDGRGLLPQTVWSEGRCHSLESRLL